jgi:hypothetical protein
VPVDPAPVANLDNQHHKPVIMDSANDAKVPDAVSPSPPKRSSQAISNLPWIVEGRQTVFQKVFDPASVLWIKLCD